MQVLRPTKFYPSFYVHLMDSINNQSNNIALLREKAAINISVDINFSIEREVYFGVVSSKDIFVAGRDGNRLYLQRNDSRVELMIDEGVDKEIYFIWSLNKLSVSEVKGIIELRRNEVVTKPFKFPNAFVREIYESENFMKASYDDHNDFMNKTIEIFEEVKYDIDFYQSYLAFWNTSKKDDTKVPKSESEIQFILSHFLGFYLNKYNITLTPEYQMGSGRLDFLLEALDKSNCKLNICIKFKLAHNKDVLKGLETQLPEYMNLKKTDNGLYVVLWFKGEWFDKPKRFDIFNLQQELIEIRKKKFMNNVKVIFFDFTRRNPPSKGGNTKFVAL